jgi:hypothetical protein
MFCFFNGRPVGDTEWNILHFHSLVLLDGSKGGIVSNAVRCDSTGVA